MQEPTGPTSSFYFDKIEQARAGDRDAAGSLLEAYRDLLLYSVRSRFPRDLSAKCDPDDVVSDAILDAWQHLGAFRGQTRAEFHSWLRQVLQQTLQDTIRLFREVKMRALSRERPLDSPEAEQAISELSRWNGWAIADELIAEENQQALAAVLAQLSEQETALVILWLQKQVALRKIAEQLGLSADEVEAVRRRACHTICRVFKDAGISAKIRRNARASRKPATPDSEAPTAKCSP